MGMVHAEEWVGLFGSTSICSVRHRSVLKNTFSVFPFKDEDVLDLDVLKSIQITVIRIRRTLENKNIYRNVEKTLLA